MDPMRLLFSRALLSAPVLATLGLMLVGGCRSCKGSGSHGNNPWARALPLSTAAYGLPKVADARVEITRGRMLLEGRPILELSDGRIPAGSMRDGKDGLFVPSLARALTARIQELAGGSKGRLAIRCQPAVPFRTLRAVLYTAMRSGFTRPWLVVEGHGGALAGLPLELPSVVSGRGHSLRPAPARTPALAVGLDGERVRVTRWGRPHCPKAGAEGAMSCRSLSAGDPRHLGALSALLLASFRAQATRAGRRRRPDSSVMVWASLDVPVGGLVRLLDALREGPGGAGSCKLEPDETATRWQRTGPMVDPAGASDRGCLYYQTVLVWSRPGPMSQRKGGPRPPAHRKRSVMR